MCRGKLLKEKKGLSILLIILIIVIFGFLAEAGFLIWQLNRQPQFTINPPAGQPAPEKNLQIPTGEIFGVWGTIASISATSSDKGPYKIESGIITLRSDYGKEYNFYVDSETLINKYLVNPKAETPTLQEDHVFWKELKAGDRIYFGSSDDLLKVFNPKVATIEIYIYE